jgi:hypothetical protein
MVLPNMCDEKQGFAKYVWKSCQKSVTISDTSRSTLLGFCQIHVTITIVERPHQVVLSLVVTNITGLGIEKPQAL